VNIAAEVVKSNSGQKQQPPAPVVIAAMQQLAIAEHKSTSLWYYLHRYYQSRFKPIIQHELQLIQQLTLQTTTTNAEFNNTKDKGALDAHWGAKHTYNF
jgi:hypothetical protein